LRPGNGFGVLAGLAPVNVFQQPRLGDMAAPDLLKCGRNLTNGRLGARGINRSSEQVAFACPGDAGQHIEFFINL
jgi:hypothetical protein